MFHCVANKNLKIIQMFDDIGSVTMQPHTPLLFGRPCDSLFAVVKDYSPSIHVGWQGFGNNDISSMPVYIVQHVTITNRITLYVCVEHEDGT